MMIMTKKIMKIVSEVGTNGSVPVSKIMISTFELFNQDLFFFLYILSNSNYLCFLLISYKVTI